MQKKNLGFGKHKTWNHPVSGWYPKYPKRKYHCDMPDAWVFHSHVPCAPHNLKKTRTYSPGTEGIRQLFTVPGSAAAYTHKATLMRKWWYPSLLREGWGGCKLTHFKRRGYSSLWVWWLISGFGGTLFSNKPKDATHHQGQGWGREIGWVGCYEYLHTSRKLWLAAWLLKNCWDPTFGAKSLDQTGRSFTRGGLDTLWSSTRG